MLCELGLLYYRWKVQNKILTINMWYSPWYKYKYMKKHKCNKKTKEIILTPSGSQVYDPAIYFKSTFKFPDWDNQDYQEKFRSNYNRSIG